MSLLPGVRSRTLDTSRLRMHVLESGPADGAPVVLLHGNLSTGRFYEHLMPGAPGRYRPIVPDMRGFGDTEFKPIDASRGLADWADDTRALLDALGVDAPPHLAGWSTGGAAIAAYAARWPVASLTLIDPVSPFGYGGVRRDGTPCFPDYAGSGGGIASPDFVQRLEAGDRTTESAASPRNVMNTSYWAPTHRVAPDREEVLLDELLRSRTGDDGYPGDAVPSENWPGVAPGSRGILNALSPKHCNWAGVVDLDPKPPILWTHGTADIVVADGAAWELGTLGQAGHVPGWPGEDVFPPQPMISQIRDVLDRYRAAGGRVEIELFEGSGHFPPIDAQERWSATFFAFLDSVA
ncbi:MAG TPA: alpha/beta hydrolase [Solirubrobacteraceae bacterium]|nr:alpha/beta hydrolase [Solirubrobacteraceae bacterium]